MEQDLEHAQSEIPHFNAPPTSDMIESPPEQPAVMSPQGERETEWNSFLTQLHSELSKAVPPSEGPPEEQEQHPSEFPAAPTPPPQEGITPTPPSQMQTPSQMQGSQAFSEWKNFLTGLDAEIGTTPEQDQNGNEQGLSVAATEDQAEQIQSPARQLFAEENFKEFEQWEEQGDVVFGSNNEEPAAEAADADKIRDIPVNSGQEDNGEQRPFSFKHEKSPSQPTKQQQGFRQRADTAGHQMRPTERMPQMRPGRKRKGTAAFRIGEQLPSPPPTSFSEGTKRTSPIKFEKTPDSKSPAIVRKKSAGSVSLKAQTKRLKPRRSCFGAGGTGIYLVAAVGGNSRRGIVPLVPERRQKHIGPYLAKAKKLYGQLAQRVTGEKPKPIVPKPPQQPSKRYRKQYEKIFLGIKRDRTRFRQHIQNLNSLMKSIEGKVQEREILSACRKKQREVIEYAQNYIQGQVNKMLGNYRFNQALQLSNTYARVPELSDFCVKLRLKLREKAKNILDRSIKAADNMTKRGKFTQALKYLETVNKNQLPELRQDLLSKQGRLLRPFVGNCDQNKTYYKGVQLLIEFLKTSADHRNLKTEDYIIWLIHHHMLHYTAKTNIDLPITTYGVIKKSRCRKSYFSSIDFCEKFKQNKNCGNNCGKA